MIPEPAGILDQLGQAHDESLVVDRVGTGRGKHYAAVLAKPALFRGQLGRLRPESRVAPGRFDLAFGLGPLFGELGRLEAAAHAAALDCDPHLSGTPLLAGSGAGNSIMAATGTR